MKTVKTALLLWSAICTLALTGCRTDTEYRFQVQNLADFPVFVRYQMRSEWLITEKLLPNQYRQLGLDESLGGEPQSIDPKTYIETMQIFTSDSTPCLKSYEQSENWEIEDVASNRSGAKQRRIYTFVVRNSDF